MKENAGKEVVSVGRCQSQTTCIVEVESVTEGPPNKKIKKKGVRVAIGDGSRPLLGLVWAFLIGLIGRTVSSPIQIYPAIVRVPLKKAYI